MPKINLILSIQPCEAEVFVRFKRQDGGFDTMLGLVDTGAELSLFPIKWLEKAEHSIIHHSIEIEQAGIAKQSFIGVEAEITLKLEDGEGNQSQELKVRAWFAETTRVIVGFQDILDRATLHIDFRESRAGWIEL